MNKHCLLLKRKEKHYTLLNKLVNLVIFQPNSKLVMSLKEVSITAVNISKRNRPV